MRSEKKYEEVEKGILKDTKDNHWFTKKATADILNGRSSETVGAFLVNYESPNVTPKNISDLLRYHGKPGSSEVRSVAPSEITTQLPKVTITRREIFLSEHLLHELAGYYAKNLIPLTLEGLLESIDQLDSREHIEKLVGSKSDTEDIIDSIVNLEKRVTKKLTDNISRLIESEKQLQDLRAELFQNLKYLSRHLQSLGDLYNSIESEMARGLEEILDFPDEDDKLDANQVFIAINHILNKESEMRQGNGTEKAPNALVRYHESQIQRYQSEIMKYYLELDRRHFT